MLADAISRAAEDEPDRLIEVSTLTGAQLVALGPRVIGAMGEPGWRDEVVAAGNAAGEASWAMPLPDDLRPGLDSPVADLNNVPGERFGGMLVGRRVPARVRARGTALGAPRRRRPGVQQRRRRTATRRRAAPARACGP